MSLMDPIGLERKVWGGQAGGPLDNKWVQATVQPLGGIQAFMPKDMQMPSPWTGMEEQKMADEEAQKAQARKAFSAYANGET